MFDRVAQFILRHGMFRPGDRVGAAVSGGADSVFLLHALRELAPRWNLALSVVHVEHGIRGAASAADAEFVRGLAARFNLPFHVRAVDVPAIDGNLEQAARDARHAFFAELITTGQVDCIATGHTRNDQAETVLYRILRGSGLAGLSGILPVTKEGIIRPLLELDRCEIETWLREHSVPWREDETNQDRAYARNRLRHEVLPLLRQEFNPRLDEALANLATLAQDEESYWEAELHQPPVTRHQPQILEARELAGRPRAVARRLIRKAILEAKGDLREIDFAHVERVLDMARSQEGHDRVQIPGLDVLRSFQWIQLAPPNRTQERDFCLSLAVPGCVELPHENARIALQILEKTESAEGCATLVNELDWQRFGPIPALEVRNWRPGDQYQPIGHSKEQKVKFLFQEARVPLWERRNWPIITYNGTIVWARRFGAAVEYAAGPAARMVLQVQDSVSSESGYRSS